MLQNHDLHHTVIHATNPADPQITQSPFTMIFPCMSMARKYFLKGEAFNPKWVLVAGFYSFSCGSILNPQLKSKLHAIPWLYQVSFFFSNGPDIDHLTTLRPTFHHFNSPKFHSALPTKKNSFISISLKYQCASDIKSILSALVKYFSSLLPHHADSKQFDL